MRDFSASLARTRRSTRYQNNAQLPRVTTMPVPALDEIDTAPGGYSYRMHDEPTDRCDLNPSSPLPRGISRSDTDFSRVGRLRRRNTRVDTIQIIENFEEFDVRPGWQPGSEPGVDTSKPDGGHTSTSKLRAQCQITIVDFSEDHIVIHELDNDNTRTSMA